MRVAERATFFVFMNSLVGKKINQTQKFLEDGKRIPVTEVFLGENRVVLVKDKDKHGYSAVQIGFGQPPVFLKEVRYSDADTPPQVGELIKVSDVFKAGDIIDVIGVSKGKGYAGVVKRHHFKGGPRTHGQSDRERAPGSIGQTTTPGRVYKGKRMAGRMGHANITVKNLKIVEVLDNTLLIKGLVPGVVNTMLFITKKGEDKKFVPLYKEKAEEEPVKEETQVKAAEVQAEVQNEAVEPKEESAPEVKTETEPQEEGEQNAG